MRNEHKPTTDLLFLVVFVTLICFLGIFSGSPILQVVSFLVASVIVFFQPSIGLVLALVLYSTQLIQFLAGIPGIIYRSAPFVLLLLSAIGLRLFVRGHVVKVRTTFFWLVLMVVLISAIVNFASGDLFGLVIAGSIYAVPFLGFYIGSRISSPELRLVKLTLFLSLMANLIAATWQSISGVDAFLSLGLRYGTSVRTIDGVVRAPGLTIINSELGLFAGIVGLFAALQLILNWRLGSKLWPLLALMLSIGCILLSTSRSGALIIASGIVIALLYLNNRQTRKAANIWSALLFLSLFLVGFSYIGATSNASWADRLAQWTSLVNSEIGIFGSGFGSVGAATFSGFSPRNPMFTDNVYLSILIQFGLIGFILFCYWLFKVLSLKPLPSRLDQAEALVLIKSIYMAFLITGILVEVIDYPLAMLCASVFIGYAMSAEMAQSSIQKTQRTNPI